MDQRNLSIVSWASRQHPGTSSSNMLVLHEYIKGGTTTAFVEGYVQQRPWELLTVDDNDDTPLHLAIRYGYPDIAKTLVACARKEEKQTRAREEGIRSIEISVSTILKMKNKEGNTASDEALIQLKLGETEAVKILIDEADQEFLDFDNISKILNVAAEQAAHEMVTAIQVAVADRDDGILSLQEALVNPNISGSQTKDTILQRHIELSPKLGTKQSTMFVEKLLDICPSLLQEVNANNDTPFHVAARCWHSKYMMKVLLQRAKNQLQVSMDAEGAATEMLKKKNKDENTAFDLAVRSGNTRVVKKLINEAGLGFLRSDHNIDKILYLAAQKGDHEMVTDIEQRTNEETDLTNALIVPHGRCVAGNTILHCHIELTVDNSRTHFAEKILDICPSLILKANADGDTPLHIAARDKGSKNMVELFLKCARDKLQVSESDGRADTKLLKMMNKDGNAALDVAVQRGNTGVVKVLIHEGGPEFLHYSNNLHKILYFAAQAGDHEIVTAIEKTRYEGGTQSKKTILHTHMISTERPSTTFVQNMLDKDSSLLEQVDDKGNTPLHVAAELGYNAIAEVLTAHAKARDVLGEMLRAENNENNTALHEAVIYRKTEVLKTLIKAGGPNFSYFPSKTPLYFAVERGDHAMVVAIQRIWESAAHESSRPGPSADPNEDPNGSPGGMTALRAAATNSALLGTQQSEDTILHIHIRSSQPSTKFVERIIETCPGLLHEANAEGDTPLHVAAKRGHSDIAEVLISKYQLREIRPRDLEHEMHEVRQRDDHWQMLRLKNNEDNTALHEAVRHGNTEIVKFLTKDADPDFPYHPNKFDETPLYLAAARGFHDMVVAILESCRSAADEGPNGMTALHAAVLCFDVEGPLHTMEVILQKKRRLTKVVDQHGWTPLHYAAYYGLIRQVELLLIYDKSVVNIVDKAHKMTALHIAASRGYNNVVGQIISKCVGCCEMEDKRGWNVLHFAMLGLSEKEMVALLRNPLVRGLINKMDKDRNTPFHIRAAAYRVSGYHFGDRQVLNGENVSVEDILKHGSRKLEEEIQKLFDEGLIRERKDDFFKIRGELRKKYEDGIKEIKSSHLLVATLIATVTFAAALTVPGGSSQEDIDQGTAILKSNLAFQTFIIADTIALTLSLSAVIVHFIMVQKFLRHEGLFTLASRLTMTAMGAMVVAFVTGIYAVLTPSSWLAIFSSCIGLSFFLILFGALRLVDLRELNHFVGFIRRISRNGMTKELTREKSTLSV